MNTIKDRAINKLIENLKVDLGSESFQIVDHWDADLYAIGIAHPLNIEQLVYISIYNKDENLYFASLEFKDGLSTEDFDNINYSKLLKIVSNHLSNKTNPNPNPKHKIKKTIRNRKEK